MSTADALFNHLKELPRYKVHITELTEFVSSTDELHDIICSDTKFDEIGNLDRRTGWFELDEDLAIENKNRKFKQKMRRAFRIKGGRGLILLALAYLFDYLSVTIELPILFWPSITCLVIGGFYIIALFGEAIATFRENADAVSGSSVIGIFTPVF